MTAARASSDRANAAAIIPARYASTRFAGKPLANRTGKFLVQHVYEQVAQARRVSRVLVATDDERIRRAVAGFGGQAVMTRADHVSGTDRLAEVAAGLDDEWIVNVQGDEPEISPADIDVLVELIAGSGCDMATLACPFPADESPDNPNLVKVVLDARGRAIYFSRSRIPYVREDDARTPGRGDATSPQSWTSGVLASGRPSFLLHRGIYAYRQEFLLAFPRLAQGPLERAEKLEQLRALENGYDIAVGLVAAAPAGIDTPEQYEAFVKRWKARGQGSGGRDR